MRSIAVFFAVAATLVTPAVSAQEATTASVATTPSTTQVAFDKQIEDIKQAMMGDPNIALKKATAAAATAETFPSTKQGNLNRATALWLQGESYNFLNQPNKAKPIIAEALANAKKSAPDTKLHGDLLRASGAISAMSGKMDIALADFLKAHDIFQKSGVKRSQAIALQDIGQIYFDARDFDRVLKYYSRSVETFNEDPWLNLTSYNNRAQVYREQGKFEEANAEYLLALKAAEQLGSPMLQARILTNLASTQVKAGNLTAASRHVGNASDMVKNAEAAGWQPFVTGVRAEIAAARGEHQKAARFLEATFAGMKLDQTELPFREFHKLASQTYEKLGVEDLALVHLKAFQRLDSQASELTASTSSQLMEARFDFANQNLRISKLKQGQLERDILIEKQRTEFRTRVFIGVAAAVLIIFALLLISFVKIRRSRNEVRVANTNLTLVNSDLETALRAKTEFLATTSHEIRTPLNGILGMTEVLLYDRKIAPDARERIEAVKDAGHSMKALVDDILDAAKMETGDISLDTRDTNLTNLLGDMLTLWHGNTDAQGIEFEVDFDKVPDNVRVDGDRLKQILSNLLSNALKFTDEGSIKLSIISEVIDDDEDLVFQIADTGCGIPESEHDRIFDPFTQVNSSMTREHSGTGLGLSICKRLTEAMKGSIDVKSTAGRGSVFTLSIPVKRLNDELFSFNCDGIGSVQSLKQASVLLIDKNEKTHAIVRTLLVSKTKSLDIVTSAEAAKVLMAERHFDHIIVEGTSVDNGVDHPVTAIRDIVEFIKKADVASTLLAAPSEHLSLAQMTQVHADQIIVKPISLPDLIKSLGDFYAPNKTVSEVDDNSSSKEKRTG